jgi:aspartyl-tRNA(Asn)/glutamyl-tRNA(Gln) amidotransferase subunit B
VICAKAALCDFFEAAVSLHNNPRALANIIANDMLREMSLLKDTRGGDEVASGSARDFPISPKNLAELVKLSDDGVISRQIAQDVFIEMFRSGKPAGEIVMAKGLMQNADSAELLKICKNAIEKNARAAMEFKNGKDVAINAIKGFVMRETNGKANTEMVDQTLRELLRVP